MKHIVQLSGGKDSMAMLLNVSVQARQNTLDNVC